MKLKKFFKSLGPGVVTGAADDDPSGIATYSQTGAQFGYGQLWLAVFMLPLLVSIQESCARIGAVTGQGIASLVKEHYSKKLLVFIVLLVFIANVINIGVDIGALAAATRLIIPINFIFLTLFFSIFIVLMEIFISYSTYAKFLKWLALSLLAYPLSVFLINTPWATVSKATFIPHIEFNFEFLFIITGVLGTTISPYLFFWETSQEVEEKRASHLKIRSLDVVSKSRLRRIRMDNFFGMLSSQIATWAIIVVTATVLNANGITDIKTAADAAKALEPLVQGFPHAGLIAKCIFATGIIGLGLLAIPVLAGSAAYAIGEALDWRVGLNLKFKHGHGFYGAIILATSIGLLLNFIGINPIKALVYCAVINGVIAVPLILVIALITNNEKIMGKFRSGFMSNLFVFLTFIGLALASLGMILSFVSLTPA